jgi:hypothetical protein
MNIKRNAAVRIVHAHGRIQQYGGIEASAECDTDRRIARHGRKHTAERIQNDALGGGIDERSHGLSRKGARLARARNGMS